MSDEGFASTILADEHDSKHIFLGVEVANIIFPGTLAGLKQTFSASPDLLRLPISCILDLCVLDLLLFLILFTERKEVEIS